MRVEIAHVSRRFGPVRANDDVSLTIQAGSIHGLLGENGAGKSTLVRILGGLIAPDAGEIRLDGAEVALGTPARALRAGIGMLHQEPLDFPQLTVLESFLAARPGPFFLQRGDAARELTALAARSGLRVDPGEQVARLSLGQRQQIELLRLLSLGARTLILDEPTTGISDAQREALFAALRRLAAEGRSIVLVSHKLADVEALCDRVTVLRHGKVAGEEDLPVPADRLVALMFGRTLAPPEQRPASAEKGAALRIEDLATGDHRMTLRIDHLVARPGEVIGLAGLEGSGQRLLLEACAGLLPAQRGRIALGMTDLQGRPRQEFQRAGVGYLPADRAREGLIAGLSLEEHVALRAPRRGPFLRWGEIAGAARRAIEAFRIRGEPGTRVEHLSGGNQQRAQLALLPPRLALLLLDHPTRGLDIESAQWIWQHLLGRCREGTAILFASADLDEIVRYSDRVIVFSGGRTSRPVDTGDLDMDRLGRMIGGEIEGDL